MNAGIEAGACHSSEASCAICGSQYPSQWCGAANSVGAASVGSGRSGRWCPGCGCTNCDAQGNCDYQCIPAPRGCSGYAADADHRLGDQLEVVQTTILKNDHGSCAAWPGSPGANCADGFERKSPDCKHCNNDFVMEERPSGCQCDDLPQLRPLFRTINHGTKAQVAAAMNMTSVFVYQASVALISNIDSGSHNYFMSKQPDQPWRIINVDPDCETVQTSCV